MINERIQELEIVKEAAITETVSTHKPYKTTLPNEVLEIIKKRLSGVDRDRKIKARWLSSIPGVIVGSGTFSFLTTITVASSGMEHLALILNGSISLLSGVAGYAIGNEVISEKFSRKTKKEIQEPSYKLMDENFSLFNNWLKNRYNIVLDEEATADILHLKEIVAGYKKIDHCWFIATDKNRYFVKSDGSGSFYITQDTSEIAVEKLRNITNNAKAIENNVIDDNIEIFVDSLKSLWDTLRHRITIIKRYEHLSVDSLHAMNRVEQDCDNLINNVRKLIQLGVEPDRQKMELVLSGLNQEMQQIIANEAVSVEHDIDSIAGWVSSRTLTATENKLVLSKTLADEVEPVKDIILIQEEKINQL